MCQSCSQHLLPDPLHPTGGGRVRACNSCFAKSLTPLQDDPSVALPSIIPPSPSLSSQPSESSIDGSVLSAADGDSFPSAFESAASASLASLDHTRSQSLSLSGRHDPHHSVHSLSVQLPTPSAAPHQTSLHPLPMPLYSSASPMSNTIASVTSILLAAEAMAQHEPLPHVTANTTLASSPRHPHSASPSSSDHPSHHHEHPHISIVVPPKHLELPTDGGASVALSASPTDIRSTEPVSPSRALEYTLRKRHNSTAVGDGHSPYPLPPSPRPALLSHLPPPSPAAKSALQPVPLSPALPGSPAPSTPSIGSGSPRCSDDGADGGSAEDKIVLDLPMKLCLVILKKTAQEMKGRYSEYLRTKAKRHEEEPLSFQQFMFFSTIRTLPDFLFKKTELAFAMMRDDGSQSVAKDSFCRYAPILPPLASKLDAAPIFELLAADLPEGRGVTLATFKLYVDQLQREFHPDKQWEGWREDFDFNRNEQLLGVRHGVTDTTHFPPHVGTVGLTNHHLIYSSVFKKRRCIHWMDVVRVERNEDGFLRRHDHAGIKLHFYRESREEKDEQRAEEEHQAGHHSAAHHQPHSSYAHHAAAGHHGGHHDAAQHRAPGHAPAAAHHHSSSSSSSSSSTSASLFHRHSSHKAEEKAAIKVVHWDLAGISSDSQHEKQRFFLHLRLLHTSHHLSAGLATTQPLTAAALLQESFDLVRRMKALESVGSHIEPLKLNPYGDFSDQAQQNWVARVRDVVRQTERVKDSKKSWLTSILPGLSNDGGEVNGTKLADIDPEFQHQYKVSLHSHADAADAATAAPVLSPLTAAAAVCPCVPQTMEEMNEEVKEAEPFSVKAFSYNVKLFVRQIQPVIAFIAMLKRIRNWDDPPVTIAVVAFLLNMCWQDLLGYLPAIVVLLNVSLLLVFRHNPDALQDYLAEKDADEDDADEDSTTGSAPVIISTLSAPAAAAAAGGSAVCGADGLPVATAVTVVHKKQTKEPSREQHTGLLAKLREYRDVAVRTKDHLETVQHGLADVNVKSLRVEGLFKWRNEEATRTLLLLLSAAFFVLVLVPFRFIFPFVLIDWVTDKWQKDGSLLQRLLDKVPLPEHMPELD